MSISKAVRRLSHKYAKPLAMGAIYPVAASTAERMSDGLLCKILDEEWETHLHPYAKQDNIELHAELYGHLSRYNRAMLWYGMGKGGSMTLASILALGAIGRWIHSGNYDLALAELAIIALGNVYSSRYEKRRRHLAIEARIPPKSKVI